MFHDQKYLADPKKREDNAANLKEKLAKK
jgi:hypothetical protein